MNDVNLAVGLFRKRINSIRFQVYGRMPEITHDRKVTEPVYCNSVWGWTRELLFLKDETARQNSQAFLAAECKKKAADAAFNHSFIHEIKRVIPLQAEKWFCCRPYH